MKSPKVSAHGFTLIELMIVVAVVAILAAIAYPSYQESVRKGRRAQARTAILELLQQQERFMTQRNCYLAFTNASNGTATAAADSECGFTTSTAVPLKNYSGDSGASGAYYLLSAAKCPGASSGSTLSLRDCVQITAALRTSGTDPAVDSLTATSTGDRSCTGTSKSSNPKLCWP